MVVAMMAAGALGGVVGGLISPAIAARLGRRVSLLAAIVVSTIHFLLIALTASALIVALALFLEMLAALLWNVVTVSYRQRLIPDDLLGRVNSIYRFFGWGTMPLGALVGGWLVAWGEPDLGRDFALRLPYVIGGAITGMMFVYGLFRLRVR